METIERLTLPVDFAGESVLSNYTEFCRAKDAEASANTDYRMQNYFNCVDDYSWGGLCDQAATEARFKREAVLGVLQRQVALGCPLREVTEVAVLVDAVTGAVVSERIVNGRFGACWIIGGGEGGNQPTFVSVTKRQATSERKGFRVYTKRYTYNKYVNVRCGVVVANISSELLECFPATEVCQRTHLPQELWLALQNNN